MWKKRNNYGVTLIELLVALSIIGMISLAVMASFGSGLQVYERLQTYGDVQADVLFALERIEKGLKNTFSFSPIGFTGESERIVFTETREDVDADGKSIVLLERVEYLLDVSSGSFVKKSLAYPFSDESSAEEIEEVLASVEKIKFTYYYLDVETENYVWKNTWDFEKEGGIPKGVKIELTFKDGERDIDLERTVFIPTG